MSNIPNYLNLSSPQRKISDSRIQRINKLFDAKIKDEVSVVSNNSTSVLHDICQPVSLIEDDSIVKYKPSRESNSPDSVSSSEGFPDELNSHFMPRLRSKNSIVQLSQQNTPNKIHNFPKRRMLKEQLGDPVPLPYLGPNKKVDVHSDLESRWDSIISNSKIRQIRTRPEPEDTTEHNEATFERSTPVSMRSLSYNRPLPVNPKDVVTLETQLKETSQKLDRLIDILQKKESATLTSAIYEPFIWLFCIIILILCNVWVYYYV